MQLEVCYAFCKTKQSRRSTSIARFIPTSYNMCLTQSTLPTRVSYKLQVGMWILQALTTTRSRTQPSELVVGSWKPIESRSYFSTLIGSRIKIAECWVLAVFFDVECSAGVDLAIEDSELADCASASDEST